jgi:hypothetical protein
MKIFINILVDIQLFLNNCSNKNENDDKENQFRIL